MPTADWRRFLAHLQNSQFCKGQSQQHEAGKHTPCRKGLLSGFPLTVRNQKNSPSDKLIIDCASYAGVEPPLKKAIII